MALETQPLVSVILPVFNGGLFIEESIKSILEQSYSYFELIIINDGSTDNTNEIISRFSDKRIVVIENNGNLGLVYSLNRGIEISKGKYLARMDADDISMPNRFMKQVTLMESDSEIGVCGTLLCEFQNGKRIHIWQTPEKHDEIIAEMFTDSNIWHPTVMIRKSVLVDNGIVYKEFLRCEDYQLWFELKRKTKFQNINEVLLLYRKHSEQAVNKKNDSYLIKQAMLRLFFEGDLNKEDEILHQKLHGKIDIMTATEFIEIQKWVQKLIDKNALDKKYKEPNFSRALYTKLNTSKQKYFMRYVFKRERFLPIDIFRLLVAPAYIRNSFSLRNKFGIIAKSLLCWQV